MSDVTRLIEAAQKGDRQAAADLLPLVYDELRKLAAARMAAEAPGHTLDATALVHEAYVRLVFLQEAAGAEAAFPSFCFIEPDYNGVTENDDHPPHDVMKAQKLLARRIPLIGPWMLVTSSPDLNRLTVPVDCEMHTATAEVQAVMPAAAA